MKLQTATKWFFIFLICLIIGFLVTAEIAHAQGNSDCPGNSCNAPPDNRPPDRTGDVTVDVVTGGATSVSESISDASATSESVSNATVTNNVSLFGESGGAGQQSAGGGNSIVSINEAERPDDIKIRNTPGVVAPDVFPTVSCFKGMSLGLAIPGAGGSFGGGKIDPECTKREEIRIAGQMGWTALALFRWCGLPNNIEEFGSREACLEYAAPPEPEPTFGYAAPELVEQFVTEPELEAADAEILAQVDVRVAEVDERVQGIEDRLNANAAAARRAAAEREAWKAELAARYLGEGDE
jgi:hypothetical protein